MPRTFLFLAGSTRKKSYNRMVASHACQIARDLDIDAQLVDLTNYELPIYNGDFEAEHSVPEAAIALKQRFQESDGFFIASPEYNSSFSPLLKNTLDWISRSHIENEKPLSAYVGKVAGLAAASPGGFGGLRGLVPLRMMLSNIQVTVVPQQVAIARAHEKLEDGIITDSASLAQIKKVILAMNTTVVSPVTKKM